MYKGIFSTLLRSDWIFFQNRPTLVWAGRCVRVIMILIRPSSTPLLKFNRNIMGGFYQEGLLLKLVIAWSKQLDLYELKTSN